MKRRGIAFFDFDGTIVRGDSLAGFARYALGTGRFMMCMLRSAHWIVAWKLGIVTNSQAKERLFRRMFGGMPLGRFDRLCEEYAGCLRPNEAVVAEIERLRRQGVETVVVSASVRNWIEPYAELLSIDHVVATEVEVSAETGCLTGNFSSPNCFGNEKVNRIKALFDIDDREIWAFSDSMSDMPLFSLSSHPCIVRHGKIYPVCHRTGAALPVTPA